MERLPLLLTEAPAETLPYVVGDVLADITLPERLWFGARLPEVVGLRAEAHLANMEPSELTELLEVDDVHELAGIVAPYLT